MKIIYTRQDVNTSHLSPPPFLDSIFSASNLNPFVIDTGYCGDTSEPDPYRIPQDTAYWGQSFWPDGQGQLSR